MVNKIPIWPKLTLWDPISPKNLNTWTEQFNLGLKNKCLHNLSAQVTYKVNADKHNAYTKGDLNAHLQFLSNVMSS